MSVRRQISSVAWWIFLSCFPGLILSAVVTLESIEIYNTHEWLPGTPTVYFRCKGENKIVLPDVKKKDTVFAFKGEESWQPLTQLESKKCKRCGFYEQDTIKSDDVYDEWEFCSSEFKDGKYKQFKEKEFNATFLCPECTSDPANSNAESGRHNSGGTGKHVAVIVLIVLVISSIVLIGLFAAYKYWQKRKRQQDQARFLKLFEDGDGLEDELELDNV